MHVQIYICASELFGFCNSDELLMSLLYITCLNKSQCDYGVGDGMPVF